MRPGHQPAGVRARHCPLESLLATVALQLEELRLVVHGVLRPARRFGPRVADQADREGQHEENRQEPRKGGPLHTLPQEINAA